MPAEWSAVEGQTGALHMSPQPNERMTLRPPTEPSARTWTER